MAKQAAYSKAFEDLFNKLLTNAGAVPPGTEQTEMIRGTQRTQWAFPEGQMNPVNVTPFQDRSLDEQKALGLVLSQLFGHGAGYEQAEGYKDMAKAAMAQAGAAQTNAATNRKGLDELLKRDAEKSAPTVNTDGTPDYVGMPPWAETVKPPQSIAAVPTGSVRTTGAGTVNAGSLNFEMTPEKLAAMGAGTVPQDKKKKKTGNPWIDGGYSTLTVK